MPFAVKKLRLAFIIYWVLLVYILAALVWWFIALNRQNNQMSILKMNLAGVTGKTNSPELEAIQAENKRKTAQYTGEGSIFFLLIVAGAVFVFRAVRRQLRQSQEQQNFMMALTHELKTPIAVAKLNLETLQKRKLDDAQRERLLQTALQETNRLNSLCNNMLLSSQIEAGGYRTTPEETDFSELVTNCTEDFTGRFPQRQIIRTVQEGLFVTGDRLLLQLAINNLLDNAIKYAPKETAIQVQLDEQEGRIRLQIKDQGKGIPEEEKKQIFQKFYRIGNAATRAAKGTGLGLYLTRKILEQHNAYIFVTDNQPTGAIFTISIPVSPEKSE
ncbi:MAG: ATP-binding protein [Ferruginibacter sp.]